MAATDPLEPSPSLLIKLGSAVVHAEEALFEIERGGFAAAQYDLAAFKSTAQDPEVIAWRERMQAQAYLPVKR